MSAQGFDDVAVRTAMAAFVAAAAKLDEASGAEARLLLDLAEAKTLAGLQLRRELTAAGWSAPVPQTASR